MLDVAEAYKEIPRNGDWTFGLLEMWGHRSKIPKGEPDLMDYQHCASAR